MKKLFLVLALSACAFNAFAQTEPVVTETSNDKERVVTTVNYSKNVMANDFKYNWEIMAALGSQFYYGDNDKYFSFFERFTFPTVDVMLTKWASPVFGFAFGLDATAFKGSLPENRRQGKRTRRSFPDRHLREAFWIHQRQRTC